MLGGLYMTDKIEITEGFASEVKKTIEAYNNNKIVTRNDVISMDGYTISKTLHKELQKYLDEQCYVDESVLYQIRVPHKIYDYSNVIFDSNEYSYNEVVEYMDKYVLHD